MLVAVASPEWILRGLAVLSTIVATLRAGSRAHYVARHGPLGRVEGPGVGLPPSLACLAHGNATVGYDPALCELATNFQACVRRAAKATTTASQAPLPPLEQSPALEERLPLGEETQDDATTSATRLETAKHRFASWSKATIARYATQRLRRSQTAAPKGMASEDDSAARSTRIVEHSYRTVVAHPDGSLTKRNRVARLEAHAPDLFAELRTAFGIAESDYVRSFDDLVSFQSNSKGAARAGTIFFLTRDGAYLIKTIPHRETETLERMLGGYRDHMVRHGKTSLLTRFCGVYTVTVRDDDDDSRATDDDDEDDEDDGDTATTEIPGDDGASFCPVGREYTFVVMNAVFPAGADDFVAERFDLKGSTVGRECSQEELEAKGHQAVRKDLDLRREADAAQARHRQRQRDEQDRCYRNQNQHGKRKNFPWGILPKTRRRIPRKDPSGFAIGANAKAALLSQLRKDVAFLKAQSVMDYSLLVGVVHTGTKQMPLPDGLLTPAVVEQIREQTQLLERLDWKHQHTTRHHRDKLDSALLDTLATPVRLLLAPPAWVLRKAWTAARRTAASVVTAPLPYYGADRCGVSGGRLSVRHGTRQGRPALYYFGLIDFLQPWTARKVLERKLKGLMGYDTDAISAVTPDEYATRFLEFLDTHVH